MSCSQKNKMTILGREVGSAVAELAVVGIAVVAAAIAYYSVMEKSEVANELAEIDMTAHLAVGYSQSSLEGSSTEPGSTLTVPEQLANATNLANFVSNNLNGRSVCVTAFTVDATGGCAAATVSPVVSVAAGGSICDTSLTSVAVAGAVQGASQSFAISDCTDGSTVYGAVVRSNLAPLNAITERIITVGGGKNTSTGSVFVTATPTLPGGPPATATPTATAVPTQPGYTVPTPPVPTASATPTILPPTLAPDQTGSKPYAQTPNPSGSPHGGGPVTGGGGVAEVPVFDGEYGGGHGGKGEGGEGHWDAADGIEGHGQPGF
jgi:hypothetical protein